MLEIITVGGGNELVRVLYAVVMTVGQSSFTTLAKLALIFGLLSSLAFIAIQADVWTKFIRYFLGAFLFFNIIIVPKTTVYVTDVTNPAFTGIKVDNVPYGLAYIITTAMSIDYTYGRAVDMAFTLPTDLRYSESGVLLGNTIIKQASQVVIGNVSTAKNMRSFLQNCVIFDLQIGKFTYEDLFKAPDLWGFITSKENSVKSRMYEHNSTMETCAVGTVKLSTELNGDVDSAIQQLSRVVFPGRTSTAAKQQLVNVIPVAYETLVGISVQAEDVVKQGMVANLMLDAAQEYTASTDADAASRAFAEARMQLTTRQTLMMSSMQASTWIGYQKTVWLLILTGAFIITAPLALLPGGIKKFLVTYVAGFFWLASWGMMYAILNSIMYSQGASEFKSAGLSISMMSMIGHKVVSENLAMTAASMIDKVPWMAAAFTGLMGGLGMGVSNLVSQQMQIAGAIAKDMADGNINFGNSNVGNHSWNNQNANKLDLSRRMVGPENMLEVANNGVEVSTHADGSKSLRAPETTGAVNVQATEQIGAALTSEASRYKEHGTSLVNEGVKSQSKVTSNVMETMWSKYSDSSDANSTRDSKTQSATQAASRVKHIVERATEGMNLSERDRAELVGSVSVGMKTPGWSPISLAANLQTQGSHARDISKMRDVATELANNKEFRNSLEEVISFAKERNLTLSAGTHNSETGSTRESYETSDQQIQRGSEQISQGERLSQAAERFKRADTSVQANLNDAFVNWLKDTGKSDQQVTDLFSPKRVAELQVYAADFADKYAQQQVNSLLGKSHPESPAVPGPRQSSSYPPPSSGTAGIPSPAPMQQLRAEPVVAPLSPDRMPVAHVQSQPQSVATDPAQFRAEPVAAPLSPDRMPAHVQGQPQSVATESSQHNTEPTYRHIDSTNQPPVSGDRAFIEKSNAMKTEWDSKLKNFDDSSTIGGSSTGNGSNKEAGSIFKMSGNDTTEKDINERLNSAKNPENFKLLKSDLDHDKEQKTYESTQPKPQREYDYLFGSRPKQVVGAPMQSREEIIEQAAEERTTHSSVTQALAHPTVSPISVADQFVQPGGTTFTNQQQDIRGMVEQAVAARHTSSPSESHGFDVFGDANATPAPTPTADISHDNSLLKEGGTIPKK